MEKMRDLTAAFYTDLKAFLSDDLDDSEYSRRMLYTGPVYYTICFAEEVPIPVNYYPKNYPIKELKSFFHTLPEHRRKGLISHFMTIEAGRT